MGKYGKYENAEDIPDDEKKFYYLGDKFRPIESIEFDEIMFNNLWPVKIPRFLHEYHGWWDIWEKERNISMSKHLEPGMRLYDVGAFDGWLACVWAQFVGGGENMVLIEPVSDEWPNTKLTWEKNGLKMPHATYMGFVGNHETKNYKVNMGAWPEGPDYSQVLKGIKFKLLSEQGHVDNTECMKIDTLAKLVGAPDAITIDVEGAGLIVLRGAEETLHNSQPLVWVAVHPQFMIERFNTQPKELFDFMHSCGYESIFIAEDHEQHWLFRPED